jgi:hypothetical protein
LTTTLRSIPVFVFVLFLVASVGVLATTQAATQYTIPVHPIKLGSQVGVAIPAEPAWAHQAVLDAMGIWNQAQEWFKQSYFPNGSTFNFTESPSGVTHVIFQYLVDAYCGSTGYDVRLALTNGDNQTLSPLEVRTCALHEFGHLLGLEHTQVPYDLMNAQVLWIGNSPSTLDLYALHIASEGLTSRKIVALPSSIPYMTVPEEALPEFPIASEIIATLALVLAFALLKRRRF